MRRGSAADAPAPLPSLGWLPYDPFRGKRGVSPCRPLHAEGRAHDLRLRLDDEAGYVTIEYEIHDGDGIRTVEERWKIVRRNGEPRSR